MKWLRMDWQKVREGVAVRLIVESIKWVVVAGLTYWGFAAAYFKSDSDSIAKWLHEPLYLPRYAYLLGIVFAIAILVWRVPHWIRKIRERVSGEAEKPIPDDFRPNSEQYDIMNYLYEKYPNTSSLSYVSRGAGIRTEAETEHELEQLQNANIVRVWRDPLYGNQYALTTAARKKLVAGIKKLKSRGG